MEEETEIDYEVDDEDETGDKLQDPDNVDDIYADLFDEGGEKATLLKTKYAELEERYKGQEAIIQKLRTKITELGNENTSLMEERKVLIRNISCIFRTAREELGRKDAELKRREITIDELNERVRGVGRGFGQRGLQQKFKSPNRSPPQLPTAVPPPPPLPPPGQMW